MIDDHATFDDLIDYRRRKLIAALEQLGLGDPEAARDEAMKLLLGYVLDEEIRAAVEWATRRRYA